MKKRSIVKPILIALGSIAMLVAIAIWIFLAFYFEGTLNKVVIPRMEQAAFNATHGRFVLTLDKIFYKHGTLVCNAFTLSRVAYDTSEHGIVLERITLDTARFEGISWWNVLWQKDLALSSLQLTAPKLYLAKVDSNGAFLRNTHFTNVKKPVITLPGEPIISLDSIVLSNISVFLPNPSEKATLASYQNITVKLTDFSLDPKRLTGESTLFSKRIDFDLPGGNYPVDDSIYSIEVRGIHGSFSDSLVTIDSFRYEPNYSEEAFAEIHKYNQGRVEFRSSDLHIRGIDFSRFFSGGGLHVRLCEAAAWSVDYYRDLRKPADPHPPDAILPHTLIASIKFPITLDSIVLNNGTIHHRERDPGSTHASLLTITHARAIAHPFCTDTTSLLYSEPLRLSLNAVFMSQGKMDAIVIYPIHHTTFDLRIEANVGPFDMPVLNSYLITNERKEITKGKCLGGALRMEVKSGKATTTISPRYENVSVDVLPDDAKEHKGILEGIKSFVANTFVLRTNNVDNVYGKAISGTTTLTRTRSEEFFQFVWLALRKSLQKIVGF
jgi:hypothetical protein